MMLAFLCKDIIVLLVWLSVEFEMYSLLFHQQYPVPSPLHKQQWHHAFPSWAKMSDEDTPQTTIYHNRDEDCFCGPTQTCRSERCWTTFRSPKEEETSEEEESDGEEEESDSEEEEQGECYCSPCQTRSSVESRKEEEEKAPSPCPPSETPHNLPSISPAPSAEAFAQSHHPPSYPQYYCPPPPWSSVSYPQSYKSTSSAPSSVMPRHPRHPARAPNVYSTVEEACQNERYSTESSHHIPTTIGSSTPSHPSYYAPKSYRKPK